MNNFNGYLYLAAPWVDREKMDERAKEFEDRGFRITHKWWKYEGEGQEHESEEFLKKCAVSDYQGVVDANVVIVFNTSKSEGKAVEQGIAIAKKKPIVLIKGDNPSHNIFHHLPCYTFVSTIEEALQKTIRNRFCKDCKTDIAGAKQQRRCNECRKTHSHNFTLRFAALMAYSDNKLRPECRRCKFIDIRALQLDHIEGGGCQHRKKLGGVGTYSWLKQNNYPAGFQVLCANCNWIKRYENGEHNKKTKYYGKDV